MADEWDRWFRRRFPFFRGGIFDEIDRIFREMEEMMRREFEEFSRITPKNLICLLYTSPSPRDRG